VNRKYVFAITFAAITGGLVGAGLTTWWNSASVSPYENNPLYDECLAGHNGNKVACDAVMRVLARRQQRKEWKADMKQKADNYLAAGFSKKEVAESLLDNGFADNFAPVDLVDVV
jgi:hypothetical protein